MKTDSLLPLTSMARQLGVSPKWLRAEAASGRIPHVDAGSTMLFNSNTVEQLLLHRASGRVQARSTLPGGTNEAGR